MKQKQSEELRQHYIKHPPEGMTSDLLDMHYFLTKKNGFDDDGLEESFYIDLFYPPLFSYTILFMECFLSQSAKWQTLLLYKIALLVQNNC